MNFKEDKWHKGEVEYPKFIVKSDKVAIAFYEEKYATAWQQQVRNDIGLKTQIIDLTNYDWVKNSANIKFHKLS